MSTADFISIGECMVEFSQGGPIEVGGDSLNTLAMAVKSGARGAYLTRIGRDAYCELILSKLGSWGIDLSLTELDEKLRNGSYRIELDAKGERSFTYDRKGSAASALSEQNLSLDRLSGSKVVFASGISQAISTSAKDAVQKAARLARETGACFAYDINFRSKLWDLSDAGAALCSLLPWIDVLFASESDLPVLRKALSEDSGQGSDHSENAEMHALKLLILRTHDRGVRELIIKRGSRSVLASDRISLEAWEAFPPQIRVRDTTAAGDAFNGAYLAARSRGESFTEALRIATAASALTVTRQGSVAALPEAEETSSLSRQIQLSWLKLRKS